MIWDADLDCIITNVFDGVPRDVDQGGEVHGLTEKGEGTLVSGGVTMGGGDINRDEGACLRGVI